MCSVLYYLLQSKFNPNGDPTFWTEVPSELSVSWLYQCLCFAFKSSIATSKYGLFSDNLSKINLNYCERDKKHLPFGLEICKEDQHGKVNHLFLTQSLCICLWDSNF